MRGIFLEAALIPSETCERNVYFGENMYILFCYSGYKEG